MTGTPRDASPAAPLDARRARPVTDARHAWLPMAAVIASLVLLVAIPLLGAWRLQPLHDEMRAVAEPARGLVTRIHVALAMQGAAVADYLVANDPVELRRYEQARADGAAAHRLLAPLAARLGPGVRQRLTALQQLQREWDARAARRIAQADSGLVPVESGHEQLFDDVLVAAALLDESIDEAAQARRARIVAAERLQRQVMAALGMLALTASVLVAWLARRLREAAARAEERRAALEQAIESRARLTRGLSHDLKNPLNAIGGHAELMEAGLRGPLTPEQADSVARIRRAVAALLLLIEDILELARADAGQLRLASRAFDLAAIARAVVDEARASAEVAGLVMTCESEATAGVVSDSDRVRQVLGNLVSNAIKYTPRGGRVDVRVAIGDRADRPGRWATVTVSDDGPGIPADQREAIFEEFTRLPGQRDKPGAGLGLAIARRIARLLRGDVTVGEAAGGGASFTLWLPAAVAPASAHDDGTSSATAPGVS